jgi:tryptophan synthase alpha subunit
VSKPEHVQQLAQVADGAIVGTAVVRRMRDHLSEGPAAIAGAVGGYCKELLTLVR